jgi:hypothetical protein
MLTEDDIKVGVVLKCTIAGVGFTVDNDYTVIIGEYGYLVVADDDNDFRLLTGEYKERLANFKLKETNMLDPEIYAVGTKHYSINGKNYFEIIARDVVTEDDIFMLVRNIATGYTSLRKQVSGKHENDNIGYNLYVAPKKHKGWINIYGQTGTGSIWPTKAQADKEMSRHRTACIEIEYEEGQGL